MVEPALLVRESRGEVFDEDGRRLTAHWFLAEDGVSEDHRSKAVVAFEGISKHDNNAGLVARSCEIAATPPLVVCQAAVSAS